MMRQACPSCPDGNEWDSNGPTGRMCRTCKGKAYIGDLEDEPTPDDAEQTVYEWLETIKRTAP